MNRHRRFHTVSAVVCASVMAGFSGFTTSARQASTAATGSVCDITTTERVVAVGDVHGAYDRFIAILREAGLIDGRQRWTGGRAVLVQTGDVLDRGADSRKVMDLLRRLETEASRAGGRVIALLGNHEVMRIIGDLRYVSAGEYAAFKTPESTDLRDRYYQAVLADEKKRAKAAGLPLDERAFRDDFVGRFPLGSIEMQMAFAADGEYGRWLRGHDTMAMVNGVVFLHGGTTQAVAAMGCAAVNAKVKSELATAKISDPNIDKTLLAASDGPLWYRGLVEEPPAVDAESLDSILRSLKARGIVVGHTVALGKLRQTFEGRVTQIDTGMLNGEFYPGGAPSALEILSGTFTAIYIGKREVISRPVAAERSALR